MAASAAWPRRPAGQARPPGHPARAVRPPRRRPEHRRAGRVRLGRRPARHPAAGRGPRPVPQVRAAAREEVELEPLEVIREHRFEDGTPCGCPAAHAPPRSPRSTSSAPASAKLGPLRRRRTPRCGTCCGKEYFEVPWRPGDLPRRSRRYLDGRETLHKRLRRDFRDDRLRWSPGTRSSRAATTCATCRPGWAHRLPGAALRRLDGSRRDGPDRGGPREAAGDPRGHRAHRQRGARPRRPRGPGRGGRDGDGRDRRRRGGRARSTRGGCPRWRRTSSARCRRSRRSWPTSAWRARCPTCPARSCCTPTRPS